MYCYGHLHNPATAGLWLQYVSPTPEGVNISDRLIRLAMSFDLMVLVISTTGLLRTGGRQSSDLWKLLFRDGIVYFIVAFIGNAVAAVSIPSYIDILCSDAETSF